MAVLMSWKPLVRKKVSVVELMWVSMAMDLAWSREVTEAFSPARTTNNRESS
jgi:hypothetical protein